MVRVLPGHGGAALKVDGLARAFRKRRAWLVTAAGALVYALAYLLVARALLIDPGAHFARFRSVPSVLLAPDLSPRYLTDLFNPAVIVYFSDAVALSVAIPTLAAVLVLGPLVGANFAVAVEMLAQKPEYCATTTATSILGVLPSFLASFACCAPTVLLLVGANFAVAVVTVVPFAAPAAFVALVASLLWSAARFERGFAADLAHAA